MSTEHLGGIPGILLPPHVIHHALESLDQAVVAIDPNGGILYWNAQAERLYGYRAEEAVGRALSDLVMSPAAAAAAAGWRTRLLPGRSCTSDWPVRDKAGRSFVASVMATPVVDDHGETVALIGLSRDVSRRRRDETRARVLAAIVEGCRDAIVEIDPHGVVLQANPAVETVYGYAPDELIGSNVAVLGAVDGVSTLNVSPVHDDTGEVVGLTGIGRDATTETSLGDALGESERRFRARIDRCPVPQAMVSLDGTFHAVNDAWGALVGLRADQLLGTGLPDLCQAGDPGDGKARLAALLGGQRDEDSWECVLRGGDGGEVPVLVHAALLRSSDGTPTGVAVFAQDRSEVHAARQALTRQDARLRVSEAGYRAIVEQAQEGIWTGDAAGLTSYANQQLGDVLGVPLSAVYEGSIVDLLDPTGTEGIARFLRDGRESGRGQFEIAYARPDASERRLRLTLSASSAVGDLQWLAMAADVTDLRHAEQELRHRRLHDDLTGLPNRTALEGQLDRAVARRQDHGRGSIAVLSADLDQFKLINESHGHVAGDAVLLEVARRLAAAVRPDDTVGRCSSGTFAVVCAESSDTRAGEIAVRLQDALTEPFDLDGHAVNLSACVGVALCPPNAAPELLRCAETAMYWAKAVGPGTVRTFERTLADEGAARLALSNDLRAALVRDTLALHYQPIVDLSDGRVLGVEALARWRHPTRGPISPASFVEAAEATGLASALGRWVLNRACREAERLGASNPTPLRVAVNISATHLADPGLEDAVLTAMRGSRLADGGLVLEITGASVLGDPTQAPELLRRLRAFGVETAIDDFGTGYSSMAYLSRLPVGTLKIDRSFIRGITTDPDSLAITESIIKLAHIMRLTVVAQGIETAGQLELLRLLGCDAGQGHLFSPALDLDAFAELIGGLRQGRFDTEPGLAPAAVGASRPEGPTRAALRQ